MPSILRQFEQHLADKEWWRRFGRPVKRCARIIRSPIHSERRKRAVFAGEMNRRADKLVGPRTAPMPSAAKHRPLVMLLADKRGNPLRAEVRQTCVGNCMDDIRRFDALKAKSPVGRWRFARYEFGLTD